jgi:hypothetical protein
MSGIIKNTAPKDHRDVQRNIEDLARQVLVKNNFSRIDTSKVTATAGASYTAAEQAQLNNLTNLVLAIFNAVVGK